jgi:SpoVK/Ycf46/Vps4 family AAA+-type ATPase
MGKRKHSSSEDDSDEFDEEDYYDEEDEDDDDFSIEEHSSSEPSGVDDEDEDEWRDKEELKEFLRSLRSRNNGPNDNDVLLNSVIRTRSVKKPPIIKQPVDLTVRIETLDDLIRLAETVDPKPDEEYSVDIAKIKALVGPLKQLRDMIGLNSIKQSIVEHLLYLLSGLNDNTNMMHTVLYGPPGSGKTHLGLILSDVYRALGFSNGKFRIVKRSDLVAGYLGQTTLKTQAAIDSVTGGVLFIDEAYSLGDREGRDSFSKEMIDCLNQNLSERKSRFICIIAGYRDELENCFFGLNPGLRRRFPFQYTIHRYGPDDLAAIFLLKLIKESWKFEAKLQICDKNTGEAPVQTNVIEQAFRDHYDAFRHQGGDVETLCQRCKIAHAKRVFGRHQVEKRVISLEDFRAGLDNFLQHKTKPLKGAKRQNLSLRKFSEASNLDHSSSDDREQFTLKNKCDTIIADLLKIVT